MSFPGVFVVVLMGCCVSSSLWTPASSSHGRIPTWRSTSQRTATLTSLRTTTPGFCFPALTVRSQHKRLTVVWVWLQTRSVFPGVCLLFPGMSAWSCCCTLSMRLHASSHSRTGALIIKWEEKLLHKRMRPPEFLSETLKSFSRFKIHGGD